MPHNEAPRILALIHEVEAGVTALAVTEDLVELRALVHRPRWTTLAEQTFVIAQLETLLEQLSVVAALRERLLGASKQVGSHRRADNVPPQESS